MGVLNTSRHEKQEKMRAESFAEAVKLAIGDREKKVTPGPITQLVKSLFNDEGIQGARVY